MAQQRIQLFADSLKALIHISKVFVEAHFQTFKAPVHALFKLVNTVTQPCLNTLYAGTGHVPDRQGRT